jgi:hypothetical protein
LTSSAPQLFFSVKNQQRRMNNDAKTTKYRLLYPRFLT